MLTENEVANQSYRNREYADSAVARSMAFLLDKEKGNRLKQFECAYCFYFRGGRLSGQAFTSWKCAVCDKESMHGNTGVPRVCGDCAKTHSLCVECGGDVHLRSWRKPTLSASADKKDTV